MVGIYTIRNTENDKVYVGSSLNIEKRFLKHKTQLKNRVHSNKHLEKSYHLYGEDSFVFIVEEICGKEELLDLELSYIIKYDALNETKGYNMTVPKKHPSLVCSKGYSKKMSQVMKGTKPRNFESMQKKRWREVDVFIDEKFYKTFKSLRDTERSLGINKGNVYNYLKGITPYITGFKNYHFEYRK